MRERARMQAAFLEDAYAEALVETVNGAANFTNGDRLQRVWFEYEGTDPAPNNRMASAARATVRIDCSSPHPGGIEEKHYYLVAIEPEVGDDFPEVLRRMKREGSDVLLVGDYTGAGATKEEFVRIFARERKDVVFRDDVAAAEMHLWERRGGVVDENGRGVTAVLEETQRVR
jgi:hypothetical protein